MNDLLAWFRERPIWLQDAARRLVQRGQIISTDLDELVEECIREAKGDLELNSQKDFELIPYDTFDQSREQVSLRLLQIKEVVGINALAPRKPLDFGTEPLVIIYGSNGSGKSGYIRLLKHICGARVPNKILGNVFQSPPKHQGCKIVYTLNGDKKEAEWTIDKGVINDLRGIAIYDTDCAYLYVDKEHEVSYEPHLLRLFRQLVEICDLVDNELKNKISSYISSLPQMPQQYVETDSGKWFKEIGHETTLTEVETKCSWTKQDEENLKNLIQRLTEEDPAKKAQNIHTTLNYLTKLIENIKEFNEKYSDEAFSEFISLKKDAIIKRQTATVDAEKVFANAPLVGIASESWRLLWEQARRYSEEVAYPGVPFPNIGEDARCVLCQQPLLADAKERLQAFENFVKSGLEIEAKEAEEKVSKFIKQLPQVPKNEEVESKLDLAKVQDPESRQIVKEYFNVLWSRSEKFKLADKAIELPQLPIKNVLSKLEQLQNELQKQVAAYENDAKNNDRTDIENEKLKLEARKWLFEQKESIKKEIKRKKIIHVLETARRLTNTKALTDKASNLSEELVTEALKERFQQELNSLGADWLQVSLEKVKATKGKVWHKLNLRDACLPANTRDILSEGEFRVVSIAAFLADMAADGGDRPFVLDDPISSLDQDFEERVAERIVELAQKRQVIVFTHRLSLLSSLEQASKKKGIKNRVISLYRESWGTGEPGDPPLVAQNPKKAINTLIDHRLSKASKVYEEIGTAEYTILAKALCSDIRITIERLVEKELLADIIQRFRRPIHTQNKLEHLSKITIQDCKFIDEMMTKYSRYEHSQPLEAPVALPTPDEIKEDLIKLKNWLEEFSSRKVPEE